MTEKILSKAFFAQKHKNNSLNYRDTAVDDKVGTFCNSMHEKLSTLEGRLESLKLNTGLTWNFLQEKLAEVQARSEAEQQLTIQLRARLEQWCEGKRSESRDMIENWKKNIETGKLAKRAHQAEEYAECAMKIAEASIDEAERKILEAISARFDAESVGGNAEDDDLSAEVRESIESRLPGNESNH